MNNDSIEKSKNEDEIDLVDILAVIIKRKWTIIILLILSFILSAAYVKLHKIKAINYIASFNIALPDEYKLDTDYLLNKNNSNTTFFINELNNRINQYKLKNINNINITTNINDETSLINVNISSNDRDIVTKTSYIIYNTYKDYKSKNRYKNKEIFDVVQKSLNQEISQKRVIINMLMNNLDRKSSIQKNENLNASEVYVINFLNNDISNIKRIKILNQEISLNNGKIEILDGLSKLILSDSTISQINNYIKAEGPSKKKQMLPIIVSVFLALFVGIFLAFIIEFFSKEDVKKRLREASKRK